jgi:hypothetical protein
VDVVELGGDPVAGRVVVPPDGLDESRESDLAAHLAEVSEDRSTAVVAQHLQKRIERWSDGRGGIVHVSVTVSRSPAARREKKAGG